MKESYSVFDVSQMLNVNEETIRRWIRNGKLPAKRAVGRSGNSILLADIVSFANRPPRAHLLSLDVWLTANKIPFERIADPKTFTPSERTKLLASLTAGSATSAIASVAIPSALAAGPAGFVAGAIGLGAASVAYGTTKIVRKLYQTYTIKLLISDDLEQNNTNIAGKPANNAENQTDTLLTPSITGVNDEATVLTSHKTMLDTPSNESGVGFASLTRMLEEITQAKQLLDAGIITADEFAEIKAKLIAKI